MAEAAFREAGDAGGLGRGHAGLGRLPAEPLQHAGDPAIAGSVDLGSADQLEHPHADRGDLRIGRAQGAPELCERLPQPRHRREAGDRSAAEQPPEAPAGPALRLDEEERDPAQRLDGMRRVGSDQDERALDKAVGCADVDGAAGRHRQLDRVVRVQLVRERRIPREHVEGPETPALPDNDAALADDLDHRGFPAAAGSSPREPGPQQ